MEEKYLAIARKEGIYAKIEEWKEREVYDEDGTNLNTRISMEKLRDLAIEIIAWWVPVSLEEFNKIKNKKAN